MYARGLQQRRYRNSLTDLTYLHYNWQGVGDPETVANHVTHEGYIYKQLQSSFGSREA